MSPMRGHFTQQMSVAALVVGALLPAVLWAQGAPAASVRVDTVASGLPVPRGIAFLSDRVALISSDRFRISHLDLVTGVHTPMSGGPAPIRVRNGVAETGIFDLLLHPDFTRNHLLYLSVAVGESARTSLAVMRARVDGRRLVDTTTLLVAAAWDTSEAHYERGRDYG